MSILSPSDFNNSTMYELANWSDPAQAERIQGAIDIYEPEFYKLLLGDTVYSAVTADPPTMPDAILIANKKSAAQYVYWYIRTKGFSQTTGTGEVQSANENSTLISPIEKMVFNWNEMVKANRYLVEHWDVDVYGEYYDNKYWCNEIFQIQNVFGL